MNNHDMYDDLPWDTDDITDAVVLEENTNGTIKVEHLDTPHGAVLAERDTLETLFKSQRYVPSSGRSRIVYPSARELLLPFLERIEPLSGLGIDLRVQTSHPVTVQDPTTGEDHTAYGRFLVEAEIGPADLVDHRAVIGFVTALDTAKPEVQVYSGRNARACINLAIFRKDAYLKAELLKGGEEAIYRMTESFVQSFGEDERSFIEKVQRLQQMIWTERQINERIGRLYRDFLTKGNLSSTLNYAIKLMADPNSRYAIRPDGTVSAWTFMSAMTQYITDKAYPNQRAGKTLEVVEALAPELLEMQTGQNN